MSTAGLSRAYAVLRQLDVLRAESIIHPLPKPGHRCPRVQSGERGRGQATQSSSRSRGESAVCDVPPEAYRPPLTTKGEVPCADQGDVIRRESTLTSTALQSSSIGAASDHHSCWPRRLDTYAPVHSHLRPGSPNHHRPQAEPPPLITAKGGGKAATAATIAGPQPHCAALSGVDAVADGFDEHAPPRPSRGSSGGSPGRLLPSSHIPFSVHHDNKECAAQEQLLSCPPKAGGTVPSRVALPCFFTSEAAHVATAHRSPAQSVVSAGGGTDAASSAQTRTVYDARRGARATADSALSFCLAGDASTAAEAPATLSSLKTSPLMTLLDGDAPSAGSTPLATASKGGQVSFWELSMSERGEGDRQQRCRKAVFTSASSPPTHTEGVYTPPREEHLVGALHQRSRSARRRRQQQQNRREAILPAAAEPPCLLSPTPPFGDLSTFYTAAGVGARADAGRLVYPAEVPSQHYEEENTSCGTHRHRLPQHEKLSVPRAPLDYSRDSVNGAGCGFTGGSEGSHTLGLADLSKDGGLGEGIVHEALINRDRSPLLYAPFGVAERRPVQSAAVDDKHQRRYPHLRLKRDSGAQSVPCGGRLGRVSLFPATYTKAVPFLDRLARVNAGSLHWLLGELAAMGEAWANTAEVEGAAEEGGGRPKEVTQSVVVDCLALDLLLNKPSALECVVVPWLRTCLESMLSKTTTYSRPAMNSSAGNHRSGGGAAAAEAAAPDNPFLSATVEEEEEEDAGGLDEGGAAANNGVLCAIIGLGSVAASLLPTLLRLFFWLPFPSPQSICDVRLVGLAIRTAGGAKGLEAMTCVVQQQAEKPHVLAAAAYALSAYSFELVGHTSALCVPPGAMRRRSGAKKGNTLLFQLVADDLPASLAASPTMEELRPLWSYDDPLLLFPTATTSGPTGPHLCLQSSPPYRPTHLMIDAEVARCELMAHLSSNQFRACHAHPHVMVLLHDALSARLLGDVVTPAAQRLYSPILSQLRRDLHRVLADDIASIAPQEQSLLRLPTLPYSLRFFAGDRDTLFAVESALLHALLARPAAALVQEQALMSLCALPPEARAHVVQPVTNFFIGLTHTMHWRQTATMRRSVVQTADSSGHPVLGPGSCIGTGEVNSDEAVVAAAAIAAGTVCMNPFAPSSCVDSCVVALVPVFQQLVHSPLWRVRHAACVGLARIGPLAPNPSSIIDLFVNCLARRAPLLTEERSSSQAPSAAAERSPQLPLLQSATVVWCLAQQQHGGVRALLRLLQDPQQPLEVHHWCAFLLAEVDVHKACGKLGGSKSLDADALLDEMVQVLGRLIVMQGALEENTVLLCVRALVGVVHRCYTNATSPTNTTESAADAVLVLDTPKSVQEAVDYYQEEQPNACFTVLTSVLETALLPTNVLKALCLYLCRYCGCHGELYVSEMLLQSRSVASRTAAAFGLRACGAKVLRSVVLGMNDDSFDVRREAFETLTVIGASAALDVLRQRPAEQRYQVQAALRDCLLLDAGRPVRRQVAELLYHALLTEEPLVAR